MISYNIGVHVVQSSIKSKLVLCSVRNLINIKEIQVENYPNKYNWEYVSPDG